MNARRYKMDSLLGVQEVAGSIPAAPIPRKPLPVAAFQPNAPVVFSGTFVAQEYPFLPHNSQPSVGTKWELSTLSAPNCWGLIPFYHPIALPNQLTSFCPPPGSCPLPVHPGGTHNHGRGAPFYLFVRLPKGGSP